MSEGSWNDLWPRIKHLAAEQAEINRRWNFVPFEQRSEADNARFQDLLRQERSIIEAYNAEHPVKPCPSCGVPRSASSNGHCFNWPGNCPLAQVMGG